MEAAILVGGVSATSAILGGALGVLQASPGLMVRQPLQRAGNPLAWCDYHAVAAPYKARFSTGEITGRGAAGRHITKQAFMLALEAAQGQLVKLAPALALGPLITEAWEAFTRDCSYAAEIAGAAVGIMQRRHTAGLRQALHQATHQAVSACEARAGDFTCDTASPCGTGSCRFAPARLRAIEAVSAQGPGRRPANHAAAGAHFNVLAALPELAVLEPFQVARGAA